MSRLPRSPEDSAADLELIRRVAAGDRRAVDDLYERFRRPAFALARRVLGDDVLAEDVLQEVFLDIWRDPTAFDGGRGGVGSWLLAMVHQKAVDAVRREDSHHRRRALVEDDLALSTPTRTAEVEDAARQGVLADRVRAALQTLPAPQREALTLAYYGGYTQREVAALTHTPLGTVKTRMLAGMRGLEDTLGTGVPGSTPSDRRSR